MGKSVEIYSLEKKFAPLQKRIAITARKTLRLLGKEGAVLRIFLAGERTMARINAEFRGKKGQTTVLCFEEPKGFPHAEERGKERLGEVFLAPACIKKRGEDADRLLIHAILHLLGYTHKGRRDTMEMENKEKELCRTS